MEKQLQRANQGKEVVRIVDEREALDNLWDEGLSNFECRISLEGSNITEVRDSRASFLHFPICSPLMIESYDNGPRDRAPVCLQS